ncbi:hypothetical protein PTTG_26602 [Puccinia triticina 1-1 BBBD Race 1]|uniref:GCM domain-containing protein n=1 Tax=Puccinia triticina (isolate 1-1 / race 1 (BBBD)) TaxID=630390 RepID=A0A180GT99_PUCT1|nr:hypothetical protein PTTG_26602 [Puccinia triticina 1-1 BBBD Race 1]
MQPPKRFPKPSKTTLKLKVSPKPPKISKSSSSSSQHRSKKSALSTMSQKEDEDEYRITSSDDADDESCNCNVKDFESNSDDDAGPSPPKSNPTRRLIVESAAESASIPDDADCSNSENGACSDSDDADPKPKRQSKEKEWFLPNMDKQFKTYIDHGCTLDKQGYPIYPNGRTTFLRLPGEQITNFGTVGYTKTCSVNYRRNRTWKVSRYFCLGALVCDNPLCNWAGAPPTGKAGKEKFSSKKMKCKGLAGKCQGTVIHKTCPDTVATRFDHHLPTGWGLLRHKGTHPHPWPEAKKPDRIAKEELKAEIKKNPKAGALKLKMGKGIDPASGFDSVVSLHPAYINRDRLAYYRQTILAELGLAPDKLGAGVGDKFLLDMFGWSAQNILRSKQNGCRIAYWLAISKMKSTKAVFCSDVTYQYFENGYLLTTSMFCDELQRWIPIQLTWMRGLGEEYYKIHFATLFRQFLSASLTPAERDTLVRQVVDFSTAQVEVFRHGTRKEVRRHVERMPGAFLAINYASQAESGAHNGRSRGAFPEGMHGSPGPSRAKWPNSQGEDIEALLFPSREPRLEDTPDGLSDTTNGQESLHRTYYCLSEGRKCFMVGMIDLYTFVDMLENDWKALMSGIPIKYGDDLKDVGASLGLGKKRKRGQGKFVNDGRPPDTTDELVKKKQKKNTGRPPNATNFNKNLWSAYPSYRRAPPNKPKRANRCWLAAGLESLFALFNPLWLRGISGKGNDLFSHIAHHFSCQTTGELNGSNTIRSTLTRGQNMIFDILRDKKPEYKQLFSIKEGQTFTCELHPDRQQLHPDRASRMYHVLTIKPRMFDQNSIPYSDFAKLMETWQTTGLVSISGLVCKECTKTKISPKPKPKPKKKAKLQKISSSDITILQDYGLSQSSCHYIVDRLKLVFDKDNPPPLHLNFHLEATATGFGSDALQD